MILVFEKIAGPPPKHQKSGLESTVVFGVKAFPISVLPGAAGLDVEGNRLAKGTWPVAQPCEGLSTVKTIISNDFEFLELQGNKKGSRPDHGNE